MSEDVIYKSEPTFDEFHLDNSFVKGVLGPVGSGKTVGCIWDIFKRGIEQEPANKKRKINGEMHWVRPTRWYLVRATYPELKRTTRKTWLEWFDDYSTVAMSSPMEGSLIMPHPEDDTIVYIELGFLALENHKDAEQMGSLEATGIFINEASEVAKDVFDKCTERVDRFPPKKWCKLTWTGVIMDTNACDDDHWWHGFAEDYTPAGWKFYKQPPALLKFKDMNELRSFIETNPWYPKVWVNEPLLRCSNTEELHNFLTLHHLNDGSKAVIDAQNNIYIPNTKCENIGNQQSGVDYWLRKVPGKSINYINVNLLNQYGTVTSGTPVYPDFSEELHVAAEDLKPIPNVRITLGWDYGRTPACTFSQITPGGYKHLFDELLVKEHGSMGFTLFSRAVVVPYLLDNFLDWLIKGLIVGFGDPAGRTRTQNDEVTCYMIANECPTMQPILRRIDYAENRRRLADPSHVEFLRSRVESGEKGGGVSLGDIGLPLQPSRLLGNALTPRLEAVTNWLTGRIDGRPAFQISPKRCRYLLKGFKGAYCYDRVQVAGEAKYKLEPNKNIYSHCHDAFQYDCIDASYDFVDTKGEEEKRIAEIVASGLTGIDRAAYDELQEIRATQMEEAEMYAEWGGM